MEVSYLCWPRQLSHLLWRYPRAPYPWPAYTQQLLFPVTQLHKVTAALLMHVAVLLQDCMAYRDMAMVLSAASVSAVHAEQQVSLLACQSAPSA